jgi:hypothetical protein
MRKKTYQTGNAPPHGGFTTLTIYYQIVLQSNTLSCHMIKEVIHKKSLRAAKVCLVQINVNVREAELLRKTVGLSYRGLRTFNSISG